MRVLTVIFLFLITSYCTFAIELEKEYAAYYEVKARIRQGYFKEALKTTQKLIKKLQAGSAKQNRFLLAQFYIEQANLKYYMDAKNLREIDKNVQKAIEISQKAFGKDAAETGLINAQAIVPYLTYGHYIKAEERKIEAERIARIAGDDKNCSNEVKRYVVRYLHKTGYHPQAIELGESLIPYMKKYLEEWKEVYQYSNNKVARFELKKSEHKNRIRVYLDHLNLITEVLIDRGEVEKAKSKIQYNRDLFDKKLSKNDIVYVDLIYLEYKLYKSIGDIQKPLQLINEAMRKNILHINNSDRYMRQSSQRRAISEDWIISKWARGGWAANAQLEGEKEFSDYASTMKIYFGNKSIEVSDVEVMRTYHRMYRIDSKSQYKKYIHEARSIITRLLDDKTMLPVDHPKRIKALNAYIEVHRAEDEIHKVLLASNEKFELIKKFYPKDCPEYHRALLNHTIVNYQFGNNFEEALPIFENSYNDIFKKHYTNYHQDYYYFGNALTRLYELMNDLNSAEKNVSQLLDDAKLISIRKNSVGWRRPHQLTEKARFYILRGKLFEAQELLHRATELFESNKETKLHYREKGFIDRTFALLYQALSEPELTNSYLRKWQESANLEFYNRYDLVDFATFYILKGAYFNTEIALEHRAEEIVASSSINNRNLVPVFIKLANLKLAKGELNTCDSLITHALKTCRITFGENSTYYAEALTIQADLNVIYGDHKNAIINCKNALEITKKVYGENHLLYAIRMSDLAMSKMYTGDFSLAVKDQLLYALKKAKQYFLHFDDIDVDINGINIHKNLTLYYLNKGQYDNARDELDELIGYWKKIAHISDVYRALEIADLSMIKGRIYQFEGKYIKALGSYREAQNTYNHHLGTDHFKSMQVRSKIAETEYLKGDTKDALNLLDVSIDEYNRFIREIFPYQDERQKATFWKKIRKDFEFYNTLAFNIKKPKLIQKALNNRLNTKALLLKSSASARRNIYKSKDSTLIGIYNEYKEKSELYNSSISLSIEELKKNDINLPQLEGDIKNLEKELSKRSSSFKADLESNDGVSWKDIRDVLGSNEYAIEIIKYRFFENDFSDSVIYAALITNKKSKTPELVLLENGNRLEGKGYKYYRNTTINQVRDKKSYKTYWKKIDEKIPDGATIFLSIDGVYNQLNVETFRDDEGKYILDKNDIILVSNTRDLIRIKKQKNNTNKSKTFLGVGNPSFYKVNESNSDHHNVSSKQKVKQLDHAEHETRQIAAHWNDKNWNTKTLIFSEATEKSFKKSTANSPQIIHIATHGYFQKKAIAISSLSEEFDNRLALENPFLKSGLFFSGAGEIVEKYNIYEYNKEDGILTAEEVKNLSLPNTDIVILSACETGRGDIETGEGVYGLQRAFLLAGAKHIIISQFKVSDKITDEFMITFTKKLGQDMDYVSAMTATKKEISKKYKDPINWGVFIMTQ